MAEPQLASPSPRRASNRRNASTPLIIAGFFLVAGISFGAGIVSVQLQRGAFSGLLSNNELDLSSLQETYRAVADNYDGTIDTQKLVEGAQKGMVNALGDQYTLYMNEAESADFNNNLEGNIGGGIGVEVGIRNDVPTVVRVLQNNPAEKAGVAVGDIIIEVNGDSTQGLELNDVVTKIRGEAGTTVGLVVSRGGAEKQFSITREQVNNPSAYGEVRDGVGILTITRFDNDTASLARAAARDFTNANVRGVVLDLRGNGGGYVTAAQDVASIWLNKQVVVTERKGGEVVDELTSGSSPILNGIKTVVLVNESSASASEIVAGALRDHGAAELVGETTFGKGSVQQLLNLSSGATLKVTVARWYTPSGNNISEKGITPDLTVKRTVEDINANKDPQLDAALGRL